ncbi:MAG: hypothetical protein KJ064_04900 [Anaerolineae bacterium]|nr:hypothetical protein [Anaerolineae bacterium]
MSTAHRLKNLWLLLPLLVAFGLYLPAIRLPFFSDDVIHLRGVSTVSSEYIMTHADLGLYYANNYYRPVVNLILRANYGMGFDPSAPFWHGLMILNHVLNTALVGLLAKQLRLSQFAVFAAMMIFAVFPFNWQVVVWVLAWFHSLVLTAVLLACTAALRSFRHLKRPGILVLAGAAAPFIHENGLFASAILVMVVILTHNLREIRWRLVAILAPMVVAAGVYIYLWTQITGRELPAIPLGRLFHAAYALSGGMVLMTVMPHWYTTPLTLEKTYPKLFPYVTLGLAGLAILSLRGTGIWTTYHVKAAYLVQGISFPFQWAAHYAPLTTEKQAWLGGLVFAGFWSVIFAGAEPSARRLLLVGAGWFALTCVLPMLYLGEGYVLSSPRLFYAAAPGIALTYAVLLDQLRGYSRFATLGIFAGVILISVTYVQGREALHTALGEAYQDFFEQLPEDENSRILVVNAPRWMASHHNPFPLDNMGAVFVPDYYPLEEFLRVNVGRDYKQLIEVTDADTMYMWDRVTGIGDVLEHSMVMELAQTHDFVYTFHIEE